MTIRTTITTTITTTTSTTTTTTKYYYSYPCLDFSIWSCCQSGLRNCEVSSVLKRRHNATPEPKNMTLEFPKPTLNPKPQTLKPRPYSLNPPPPPPKKKKRDRRGRRFENSTRQETHKVTNSKAEMKLSVGLRFRAYRV